MSGGLDLQLQFFSINRDADDTCHPEFSSVFMVQKLCRKNLAGETPPLLTILPSYPLNTLSHPRALLV